MPRRRAKLLAIGATLTGWWFGTVPCKQHLFVILRLTDLSRDDIMVLLPTQFVILHKLPDFACDVVSRRTIRAGAALPIPETDGYQAKEDSAVPRSVKEAYYTLLYAVHISPMTITPSIH